MPKVKTCEQFCENFEKKLLDVSKKFLGNFAKKKEEKDRLKNAFTKRYLKKFKKVTLKECNKIYCNKTCKNTLLEPGKNKYPTIPKKLRGDKILYKILLDSQERNKKKIFGDKDTVIKDGFYEKFNSTKVNKLKKEGAISACTTLTL